MADRILKPDSGNDLVLQNDDGSAKIEINEAGTIVHTGTSSIDVSGGTFTTSSAQKTAIVDGGKGNLTKSDVGLSNVTNDAQVPASGGTFSGNVTVNGDLTVDTNTLTVDSANNRVGIGKSPDVNLHVYSATDHVTQYIESDASGGSTGINARPVDTGSAFMELGVGRTGNGYAIIDFVGDATYTDYGLRIIRNNTGANTHSQILHRGTGFLGIQTEEASDILFSTSNTERMRIDSSGNLKFNSGYGSVVTAYGCRAWVNFNGTGTVAIRASGNVSSITDNGIGKYTVNFTSAMPDANYSFFGACGTYSRVFAGGATPTTSSCQMWVSISTSGTLEDNTFMYAGFFR